MSHTPTQKELSNIRELYELRERRALGCLRTARREHEKLRKVRDDIQSCVDEFRERLKELDRNRATDARAITAHALLDEAKHRAVIDQDLQLELVYLNTAENDLVEATQNLSKFTKAWQKTRIHLDALLQVQLRCDKENRKIESDQEEKQHEELAQRRGVSVTYG